MKRPANHFPSIMTMILLLSTFSGMLAQAPPIKIWPDLAPGTENREDEEQWTGGKSVSNVYQPDLTVFLPENREETSPAILVFPGGGYRNVVMAKEGYRIAKWLNENGIAAFVLKYRLDVDEALQDAQRALRVVRNSAETFGIDENKIGVMGFSAGAHLAGNLCMNDKDFEDLDAIDKVSARPDFFIGVYGGYGGIIGSGKKAPGKKVKVKEDIPPTFLVHAGDDSRVSALGSVELYTYLLEKGIPAELHIYEKGEHGFALEKDRGTAVTSTVNSWSARLLEWLKVRGFYRDLLSVIQ